MRSFFNFLSGVIIGGFIGGLLMLLFTPYPGSVVRQRIDDYTHQVVDDVRDAARARGEELRVQLEQLQGRSEAKVE